MARPGPRPGRRTGAAHRRRRARLCCRDAATGPAPALRAQLPDALRRARPDQVVRGAGHLPVVLLQLRPARQLPRYRHRLPARPGPGQPVPLCPGGPGPADRCSSGCSRSRSSGPGTRGSSSSATGSSMPAGRPRWVTLPIVFLAVAAVMAMIGEGVARTFITFRAAGRLPARHRSAASPASRPSRRSRSSTRSRSSGRSSWPLVLLLLYGTAGRPAPGRRGRRRGAAALVGIAVVYRHLVALVPASRCSRTAHDRYSPQRQRHPAPEHHPGAPAAEGLLPAVPGRSRQPLCNVLIVGAGTGDDVANALLHGA